MPVGQGAWQCRPLSGLNRRWRNKHQLEARCVLAERDPSLSSSKYLNCLSRWADARGLAAKEVLMHAVQYVSPDALKPNPRNARTHSKKQIRQIADSIVAYGFTVPVLIDENSVLLAGHGRLEAAKLLGLKKIPAITLPGLSEAQKRAC